MKSVYLFPVIVLFFLSCGEQETDQSKTDSTNSNGTVHSLAIHDVQTIRPNIDYVPWEGNLNDAIYWRDSRGENIVVISSEPQYFWEDVKPRLKDKLSADQDPETFSEATELFARHYTLKIGESKWKLYSEYTDVLMGCCDVFMEYQQKTLAVRDMDSSGNGEAVFMYHTTEGDGKIEGAWEGHMVLMKDSTSYESSGISSAGEGSIYDYHIVPGDKRTSDSLNKYWMDYTARWREMLLHPDTTISSGTGDIHIDHVH